MHPIRDDESRYVLGVDMNKLSRVFLASALLCIFSVSASAAEWTTGAYIKEIFAIDDSTIILKLSDFDNESSSFVNADKCDIVSGYGQVILDRTTRPSYLSMILAAKMAQQKVNFYVSGCTAVWTGTSFAKIAHMKLL